MRKNHARICGTGICSTHARFFVDFGGKYIIMTDKNNNKTGEQIAVRVSFVGILFNIILTAFKLTAGIFANSMAMVSDAVHSLSDILGGMIVVVGVKISNKTSDKEHPYGHERFECVAAIILAVILAATGLFIGYGGVRNIYTGNYKTNAIPGLLALVAAVVSIVIKEGLFWYTRFFAKKINSTALTAGAWHHRSDAFSSVGSFAGILGARIGFPLTDSLACIIICVFIVKAGIDIFIDAIDKMTDKAVDDESVEEIRGAILTQGDFKIDELHTRLFGDKIYVDLEISIDGNLSLNETHDIAHNIHDAVEKINPKVKHCMVHVNPHEE